MEPDDAALMLYREKQAEFERQQQELKQIKGTKAITKNGVEVEINANIGHPSDVDIALRMMRTVSDFFEANFFIWKAVRSPVRKNSSRHIEPSWKRWLESALSSEPWT